jgi:hypothetical protein
MTKRNHSHVPLHEYGEGCYYEVMGPYDGKYEINHQAWTARAGELSTRFGNCYPKFDDLAAAHAYAEKRADEDRGKIARLIERGGLYGPDDYMLDFSYGEINWVRWNGRGYDIHGSTSVEGI